MLAALGWLPRVCLVFLPVGLWLDRWLARWARQPGGGSERWARGLALRLFVGEALTVALAYADYLDDALAGRPAAGLGTVRGRPSPSRVTQRIWYRETERPLEEPVMGLPQLIIVRHGDTAWTDSHQHTGRTDLPLNEKRRGTRSPAAPAPHRRLRRARLHQPAAARRADVRTGRLRRERRERADLYEWDYGEYEGKMTADIRRERPDWDLFRDGCPGGESPDDVAARADRFIARVRALSTAT